MIHLCDSTISEPQQGIYYFYFYKYFSFHDMVFISTASLRSEEALMWDHNMMFDGE